jgi:signal transduction histidine kinase
VQSGKHEEKARIEIEKLAEELKTANEQQSVLIHFVTHQIKGFFTMSRNIFSLMLENTFGELNPGMKRMVQQGFDNTTKGVATVQEILNAANLKKGTVQMKMISFDARALVDEILADLNPRVVEKKLQLSTVLSSGPLVVVGDRFQLHEVYKNLVDNAIRYTPQGKITVTLEKQSNAVHFSVTDSGVGLSEDDKKRLFTEGGRGKDSLKVNVDSTGFGLFIAKGIVDAHKGHIWAESEGPGKGSTFAVELPLVA